MNGLRSCLLACALLPGCAPGEAPAPPPGTATPTASAASPPAPASSQPSSTTTATATRTVDAGPVPPSRDGGSAEPLEEPPLLGPDGAPLPQTEERPSASSPSFQHHMGLLFRAIVQDDPAIAEPSFFPRIAYEQVKDIPKPGLDWQHRLMKAFRRDVHDYHRKLGASPEAARLLRVEVPEERAQWMKRGAEGNRVAYWRVKRAQLVYQSEDGKEHKLEITSCISWRGEWYVVHLHGFK